MPKKPITREEAESRVAKWIIEQLREIEAEAQAEEAKNKEAQNQGGTSVNVSGETDMGDGSQEPK